VKSVGRGRKEGEKKSRWEKEGGSCRQQGGGGEKVHATLSSLGL